MMQTERLPVCYMGVFDDAKDFWIDSISNLLYRFPILDEKHINLFYIYLIIEKGTGKITVNNHQKVIDGQQIFIIKPDCIHTLYLNKEAKGKIICFTEDFFSLRYNNNILKKFSFFKWTPFSQIRPHKKDFEVIKLLSTHMYKEFGNIKQSSNKILRSYLNILLIETERLSKPNIKITSTNISTDRIYKLEQLIKKHIHHTKKPSDYAKMLNISTNYLNKICKQNTGYTTGKLIRKQVILEAKQLLFHTNYTVSEIGYKLGFEHPSYFVSLFKKETDLTPEAYRKESGMEE